MSMHYHFPSHPDAYPGGYLSYSTWIDVGLREKLCIIEEMDAESGKEQRDAIFILEGMVELLHFKDWRDAETGRFKKRTLFLGRWSE